MKDLIKSVLSELKKKDAFVFVTEDGQEISLQEASKKGLSVTPKNPKIEAQNKLAEAGLDLTDLSLVKDITEAIELINGGKSGGTKKASRTSYSEDDKINYVREFRNEESKNSSMNTSKFSRAKGLNYQTLNSWVKKYEDMV